MGRWKYFSKRNFLYFRVQKLASVSPLLFFWQYFNTVRIEGVAPKFSLFADDILFYSA